MRACAIALACVGMSLACAAPISTMRSPMHLRVVELFNQTQTDWILLIEPAADQHLGAATTFTGRLRPGETKTLYLYHGFRYRVDVLERGGDPVTSGVYYVDRDMGLIFGGDSLRRAVRLTAELGEPTTTFADNVNELDPFDLRSRPIQPDTTRLRGRVESEERQREEGRRPRP